VGPRAVLDAVAQRKIPSPLRESNPRIPIVQPLAAPVYLKVRVRCASILFHEYNIQLSGISLGYGLDVRGFESWQGLGIFLFTTASRPAVGPTQPPIQWVPGAPSPGVKRPEPEADHSPPSSAEVKE
jgi:hypothetical protein